METTAMNDDNDFLTSLVNLVVSNSEGISRFGARMVVLCKFVDATLPQLSAAQCREVVRLFRQGIEDAMSLTDDIAMPAGYHEVLLEQTNVLLTAMEAGSARRR